MTRGHDIAMHLRSAYLTLHRRAQNHFSEFGVTADQYVILTLLAQKDYQVVEAENGVLALRYLRERAVDLVLLDVMMPEMDGFETCRRIREDMGDLLLPVVFVTALDDRESRIQGKAVGADDFLTKPVDAVELFARVDNLLKVKAYHDLRANQQQLLEEELTRTRERLIRADRLATLGTLTAGVGHELGNVATIISTARQMMSRALRYLRNNYRHSCSACWYWPASMASRARLLNLSRGVSPNPMVSSRRE